MLHSLEDISELAARFARDREWQQFQSPKNLAMALSVEVAELVEHFQWLREEESRELATEKKEAVADEIADVLLYLLRIADELDINIYRAVASKAEKNEAKYPVDRVKGSALKYTAYQE